MTFKTIVRYLMRLSMKFITMTTVYIATPIWMALMWSQLLFSLWEKLMQLLHEEEFFNFALIWRVSTELDSHHCSTGCTTRSHPVLCDLGLGQYWSNVPVLSHLVHQPLHQCKYSRQTSHLQICITYSCHKSAYT